MFDEGHGAGHAAISYTDQFFDGAIAKIDAAFGQGFARQNPALVGAYMQSCAANLSAFMQSAMALSQLEGLAGNFAEMEEPQPRKRRAR